MLVLSHRGYHVHLPENTLDAFAAAVDMGVDGIETDIRLFADGKLGLFHDRYGPDGRRVERWTLAELSAALGHEVPTLESALDRFPDILWNLEIKEPEGVDGTVAAVRARLKTHRFFVSSFWHTAVDRVRRSLSVPCAFLLANRPLDLEAEAALWWRGGESPEMLVWKFEFLEPGLVAQARALGIETFAYAVDTPEDHCAALEWGLDGIITDRPEFLPRS